MADTVKLGKAYIATLDLSGEVGQMSPGWATEIHEYRTFDTPAVRKDGGLVTSTYGMQGVFNRATAFATLADLEALKGSKIGASGYIRSVDAVAVAVGDLAMFGSCILGTPNIPFEQGGLARWEASLESDRQMVVGQVLAIGQKTASGAETGVQLGAVASGRKIFALLHVPAADAGTLNVVIESDDNGSFTTPTTRLTFTQVLTTPTWQLLELAGPVTDDWWRANLTSGAGDHTIGLAAGIA